jgi:AcrR family transcriptional regulator
MATTPGRGGRPAAADRDALIAMATEEFIAGRRIELRTLAARLGLSRTTLYRWFGTREELIGAMLADGAEAIVRAARKRSRGGGGQALLATFDAVNRLIASNVPLHSYIEQEGQSALRVLTRSDGIVQARVVAAIRRVIEEEVNAGRFEPPTSPATLAYAVVRLGEAFLYNDSPASLSGDVERLREVEAALLGVAPRLKASRSGVKAARSGAKASRSGAQASPSGAKASRSGAKASRSGAPASRAARKASPAGR